MNWKQTNIEKPTEDVIVHTKIDDAKGVRNEQMLIYSQNLWWLRDKSMYMYYTPTHWKY